MLINWVQFSFFPIPSMNESRFFFVIHLSSPPQPKFLVPSLIVLFSSGATLGPGGHVPPQVSLCGPHILVILVCFVICVPDKLLNLSMKSSQFWSVSVLAVVSAWSCFSKICMSKSVVVARWFLNKI